ncbi:hypothetical protein D9619_011681 [Psilocybe cf. subviscida]|uniref:DUF6535 domain-containing protein n=1 Tax=Psilocybe cf. subviscida TaxID=2480587 RepID=A0A8H5BTK9_9AGAR|nr:hypothetical protein D9619_011681 [Psilocybe cf. subviscida]
MSNTQELEKAQNGSDNYEEYFLISENAPIWSLYNDESSKIDAALQDMANKSIDVLLVFTGLFSAVLTALIIFVYQSSTPGPLDQSNALLIQYFQAQNITLNNSALSASPPSSVISGQKLAWVNAIWMISIALSLADATFCILAKQWLRFQPIISGSPRFKARQRQRRYTQFEAWHVMTVVNTLPIFLHVAILLFFIGLVIMLWGGSLSVTVIVLIAVASVVGCYIGSIWLSLLYPDCPFQHPISEQLRFWRNTRSKQGYADLERTSPFDNGAYDMDADDKLDALALVWLLENCSSRSTPVLGALQAIGQLPSHFTALYYLQRAGAISLILEEFRACFRFEIQADLFVDHRDQWRVVDYYNAEKYCRSWMRLTRGTTAIWPAELVPLLDAIVAESSSHYLDVQSVEPILPGCKARPVGHLSQNVIAFSDLWPLCRGMVPRVFFESFLPIPILSSTNKVRSTSSNSNPTSSTPFKKGLHDPHRTTISCTFPKLSHRKLTGVRLSANSQI